MEWVTLVTGEAPSKCRTRLASEIGASSSIRNPYLQRSILLYNASMAMRDLQHLQAEAEKLSREQQLEFAQFLIECALHQSRESKPVDLAQFYGAIDFPEDGLKYQRRIRAEWG